MLRLLPFALLLLAPVSCGGSDEPATPEVPGNGEVESTGQAQAPESGAAADGHDAESLGQEPEQAAREAAPEGDPRAALLAAIGEDPFAGFTLFRDDVEIDVSVLARHAGTEEDPIPVDIDFLGVWEFHEDADPVFPPYVSALDGRVVRMQGFMLPGVDFEHITQFQLVRSLWGCCFGAPPRINEMIRVNVAGEGLDYTYNTLVVTGRLRTVLESIDGVVEDLYRLEALDIEILDEYLDPGAPAEFNPATGFEGVLPDDAF